MWDDLDDYSELAAAYAIISIPGEEGLFIFRPFKHSVEGRIGLGIIGIHVDAETLDELESRPDVLEWRVAQENPDNVSISVITESASELDSNLRCRQITSDLDLIRSFFPSKLSGWEGVQSLPAPAAVGAPLALDIWCCLPVETRLRTGVVTMTARLGKTLPDGVQLILPSGYEDISLGPSDGHSLLNSIIDIYGDEMPEFLENASWVRSKLEYKASHEAVYIHLFAEDGHDVPFSGTELFDSRCEMGLYQQALRGLLSDLQNEDSVASAGEAWLRHLRLRVSRNEDIESKSDALTICEQLPEPTRAGFLNSVARCLSNSELHWRIALVRDALNVQSGVLATEQFWESTSLLDSAESWLTEIDDNSSQNSLLVRLLSEHPSCGVILLERGLRRTSVGIDLVEAILKSSLNRPLTTPELEAVLEIIWLEDSPTLYVYLQHRQSSNQHVLDSFDNSMRIFFDEKWSSRDRWSFIQSVLVHRFEKMEPMAVLVELEEWHERVDGIFQQDPQISLFFRNQVWRLSSSGQVHESSWLKDHYSKIGAKQFLADKKILSLRKETIAPSEPMSGWIQSASDEWVIGNVLPSGVMFKHIFESAERSEWSRLKVLAKAASGHYSGIMQKLRWLESQFTIPFLLLLMFSVISMFSIPFIVNGRVPWQSLLKLQPILSSYGEFGSIFAIGLVGITSMIGFNRARKLAKRRRVLHKVLRNPVNNSKKGQQK